MRATLLFCTAVLCLALGGCWDFPQSRYTQDAESKDTVAVDQKSDGPRLDKQKPPDSQKPKDKPKPPQDKQKPLDKQKPPLDKPKPPTDLTQPPDQKVLLSNGAKCGSPAECKSNICAQGRCCNAPCAGTCVACDLAGKEGACSPVPPGHDPHNSCSQDPAASCKKDGECDGAGACRQYGPGTVCAPGNCSNGKMINIKHCDGKGNCNPAPDQPCFPFKCNTASKQCHSSCTKSNQSSHCSGYYACNTSSKQCYSSCSNKWQCKSGGECEKKKCVEDD